MNDSSKYGRLVKENVILLSKTRFEYQLDTLRYISFTWNEQRYIPAEYQLILRKLLPYYSIVNMLVML